MLCHACNDIVGQALQCDAATAEQVAVRPGGLGYQFLEKRTSTGHQITVAAERGCYMCQVSTCRGRDSIVAKGLGESREALVRQSHVHWGLDDMVYLITSYEPHRFTKLRVKDFGTIAYSDFGLESLSSLRDVASEGVAEDHGDSQLSVTKKALIRVRRSLSRRLGSTGDAMPKSFIIPSIKKCAFDYEIPRNTGSKKVLGLVRQWLSECVVNHTSCMQMQGDFAPERLVHVSLVDDRGTFRVTTTQDIQKPLRYLTLSHRWDAGTQTLNKKTADSYRTQTPWTELSKTYRDAFAIVTTLGFSYIWIDSLCISQDDRDDMLTEGLSMMQVYSGAVCNLSALEGHSRGMFATRYPSHVGTAQALSGAQGLLQNQHIMLVDGHTWRSEVDEAPLNQRGWVLQERLLAARTVYFSKTQVFWECSLGRRCEGYPALEVVALHERVLGGAGDDFYSAIRRINVQQSQVQAGLDFSPGSSSSPLSWYDLWVDLLRLYIPRAISFPGDRLLAIAGIAKLFAKASHLTWAAGLWKEHMPRCLLWQARGRLLPRESTCFPTWSWVSIAGEVVLADRAFDAQRVVARVTEIECTTNGDDQFGLLSSARLRLQAQPIKVELSVGEQRLGLSIYGEMLNPSWQTISIVPDRLSLLFGAYIFDLLDTTAVEPQEDFVALVMNTHAHAKFDDWIEISLRGLILEKCQHVTQGSSLPVKWKRAGYFEIIKYSIKASSPIVQSEIFSLSASPYGEDEQTHAPFDFDTATSLETFDIF